MSVSEFIIHEYSWFSNRTESLMGLSQSWDSGELVFASPEHLITIFSSKMKVKLTP